MAEANQNPEYVQILDTTLRDGAQSPGIALTQEQSLKIANQLNRLGVDVIEAGFPISSPANFAAVQTIAQEVDGPIISALARAQSDDIATAGKAVKDAHQPRIHTFLSTSPFHLAAQGSTPRQVIELTRASVTHAKSLVDDVEFSPMDASRTDIEFLSEVVDLAIQEGATVINIPDTVGNTTPDEYQEFLERLRQCVPAIGGVILSVHCHDDLGLAVANSFAGVRAGARQVEGTINGIGERAGNTAIEELAMLLKTRSDRYPYVTGINTKAIGPASRMVASYTGYKVPRNKAVVGRNAFRHESGIHQKGVIKDRKTFEIMSPEEVGMDTDAIVLGKQSGRDAIRHILEGEGVLQSRYMDTTFELFKEAADVLGEISTEEIVAIHEEAERRANSDFKLNDLKMTNWAATLDLDSSYDGKHGVVFHKENIDGDLHPNVDGSISLLFASIKYATGTDFALEDFQIDSVGKGEKALAEAYVELRINGNTVSSKGISMDTNRAAAWAYLSALTKAVRADKNTESIEQI